MSETLFTARFESPVGELQVASSTRGLCYVALPRASGRGLAGWQRRHAPHASVVEGYEPNREAIAQLTDFLEGKREVFDLALDLRATSFQSAVYEVVADIAYGDSLSYAEVAAKIGKPTAVRAVGAANGANPIPLVIPCHRVVAKDGHLQGYAGGLDLKARLLAMESASRPAEGALL
jgi:methylated-DNA-[protein]-cysteine S-methyltransferase